MNNKIVLSTIAVIVVLGGVFLLSKRSNQKSTQNTTPASVQNQNTVQGKTTPTVVAPKTTTVTLTSSGFEPATVTVSSGTIVIWVNKSGEPGTVNSDPHPTHNLWPFLNLGEFKDGSSVQVKFDKAGIYTYHNHLNPSQKGTVVVQ